MLAVNYCLKRMNVDYYRESKCGPAYLIKKNKYEKRISTSRRA